MQALRVEASARREADLARRFDPRRRAAARERCAARKKRERPWAAWMNKGAAHPPPGSARCTSPFS